MIIPRHSDTKQRIYSAFILLFSLYMLINPSLIINCAHDSIVLFAGVFLPSILPFMIIIQLLIKVDRNGIAGFVFRPAAKLLNIPIKYLGAVSAGILAGYPNGAVALKNIHGENESRSDLYGIIILSSAASPMFMLGTVGQSILSNSMYAILIMCCHYIGLFATVYIIKKKGSNIASYSQRPNIKTGMNIFQILEEVLLQCSRVLIKILGFIIIFRIFSETIIQYLLPVFKISDTNILNIVKTIIKGSFELIEGCSFAQVLEPAPACTAISFLLGFGGLSVLFQIMSILKGLSIKFYKLLAYKLLHGILSASLCALLLSFIQGDIISVYNETIKSPVYQHRGLPVCIIIILSSIIYLAVRQWPRIWVRFCRTISRLR